MNTIMRHLALLALLPAVMAPASAQRGPDARLEAARLATEVEGDHAAAMLLYAGVRQDESAAVEQRERATYEGALLARKLGRHDEAKSLFESIAKGDSDWAEKARAALEGGPEATDPRTAQRIFSAIAKLAQGPFADGGAMELDLIGATAVPYLAQAIRREYSDLSFTMRAVHSLISIGGEGPAAFFREVSESDDDIFRRTVVDAIKSAKNPDARVEPMLAEIRRFLADEDAQIRAWMVGHLKTKLTVEERTRALHDEEQDVVQTLLANSRDVQVSTENVATYCAAIDVALARHPSLARKLIGVSATGNILETKVGLNHYLDLLEGFDDLRFENDPWGKSGRNWVTHFGSMPDSEKPSLRDFIERIPRLTLQLDYAYARTGDKPIDRRGRAIYSMLYGFVSKCGHDSMPDLLDLLAALAPFHLDDDIEERVVRLLEPGDAVAVTTRLEDFRHAYLVADWLRRAVEPSPDLIAPIRSWLAQRLKEGKSDGLRWASIDNLIDFAVKLDDDVVNRQIVEATMAEPRRFFSDAVEAFITQGTGGAVVAELLGVKVEGADRYRMRMIRAFVRAGDLGAMDAIIDVFKRRLDLTVGKSRYLPDWNDWGYEEADSLRLLDALLATGDNRAWTMIKDWPRMGLEARRSFVRHMKAHEASTERLHGTVSDIMHDVIEMATHDDEAKSLCERLLTHPDKRTRHEATRGLESAESPLVEAWVIRALADPDAGVAGVAAEAAGNHRIEAAIPLIEEYLDRTPGNSRAMDALVLLAGDKALERLTRVLRSPNEHARRSACLRLGRMTTREAIPPLIVALRDASKIVREAAQESLQSLQFYFDQKSKWDAWSRGAGLDGGSAAEALIEQAQSEKKEIRLAAIASLATLKEATTLPFLIKLMTDTDADIAAAAKAAVTKINTGK